MIHLGNYEEFFILYMDNELDANGKKMVEDFLLQHPDLQSELEMLMSTRLPMESLFVDKDALHSDVMKGNLVDENLLLYIDGELPASQKKELELELASNKEYGMQHQMLRRTKLDASEIIPYPNKKELYRKEERRGMVFSPWMRIAAAVMVILAMGVVYLANNKAPVSDGNVTAYENKKEANTPFVKGPAGNKEKIEVPQNEIAQTTKLPDDAGSNEMKNKKALDLPNQVKKNIVEDEQKINDLVADVYEPRASKTGIIETGSFSDAVNGNSTIIQPSEIVNTHSVTSALASRKTDESVAEMDQSNDVANNKGSFKGFLRKATRLIEKKTGIDPTNDGELLIGAVAINLK